MTIVMLITGETIQQLLTSFGISVHGALHIGAHECEEDSFYKNTLGISDILWIDALQHKVDECKARGISNVYQAVITDKDDEEVVFHISNNGQSSSVLAFGTHETHHSWVHYVGETTLKTTTVDTFFERHGLNPEHYDFWNFDIQGAELMALRGAARALQFAKAIYLEVNTEEVYRGCAQIHELDTFLATHGFKRVLTKMTEYGWGDALYVRV